MTHPLLRYPTLKLILTIYIALSFTEGCLRGYLYQHFAPAGTHLTPLLASLLKMLVWVGAAYLLNRFAIKQVQALTQFETDTVRLSTTDRLKVFGLRAVRYLFILSALAQTGYTLGRLFGLFSLF